MGHASEKKIKKSTKAEYFSKPNNPIMVQMGKKLSVKASIDASMSWRQCSCSEWGMGGGGEPESEWERRVCLQKPRNTSVIGMNATVALYKKPAANVRAHRRTNTPNIKNHLPWHPSDTFLETQYGAAVEI